MLTFQDGCEGYSPESEAQLPEHSVRAFVVISPNRGASPPPPLPSWPRRELRKGIRDRA